MDHRTGTGWVPRLELAVLIGLAVAALVVLDIVPLRTVLSLGVFLICPLMMLRMHGTMRGGGHGGKHGRPDRDGPADEPFDGEP